MIESIEYTNRGCRECNQDYVLSKTLSDSSSLFVIADGMGGYAHGEVASMIVATAISEFVEINFNKYSPSIFVFINNITVGILKIPTCYEPKLLVFFDL